MLISPKDLQAGEVIFREEPLAAIQHSISKEDCLNCNRCCCFLGSIEIQVAWKLRSSGNWGLACKTLKALEAQHAPYCPLCLCEKVIGFPVSAYVDMSIRVCHSHTQRGFISMSHTNAGALVKEDLDMLHTGNAILPLTARYPLPRPVSKVGGLIPYNSAEGIATCQLEACLRLHMSHVW